MLGENCNHLIVTEEHKNNFSVTRELLVKAECKHPPNEKNLFATDALNVEYQSRIPLQLQ